MWTCKQCGEAIDDQFDSCWKCACEVIEPGLALQEESKKSANWLLSIVAAILAPALADCIQSLFVSRAYQAELYHMSEPAYWIVLSVRALLTLMILVAARKFHLRDLWVWLGCVAVWLCVARQAQVVIK